MFFMPACTLQVAYTPLLKKKVIILGWRPAVRSAKHIAAPRRPKSEAGQQF